MSALANLGNDDWNLLSAEERTAEHPKTFRIPWRFRRKRLGRGRLVKLMFEVKRKSDEGSDAEYDLMVERMWVWIERVEEGTYHGRLANRPTWQDEVPEHDLVLGAHVSFLPEHIIDIGAKDMSYGEALPDTRKREEGHP